MHLDAIIAGTLPETEEEAVMSFTGAYEPQGEEVPGRARSGEKVSIAYVHLDSIGANFTESVLRMISYDHTVGGDHLMHGNSNRSYGAICPVWGRGGDMAHARNTATAAFLQSDADWLLWIDTDMGFEAHVLEVLLSVADPETAPVVGGLCFIEGDYTHDWKGGLRSSLSPTLYDWCWMEPSNGLPGMYKLVPRSDWPDNAVTRVGATGAAFLLTHRSVYEKISQWCMEQGAPPNIWWQRIPGPDGELCGEDVSFCLRVHQVDLPVLVHTGVKTTHQKTTWYGEEDYRNKPFTPPKVSGRPLGPSEWPKLQINRDAAQRAARESPMGERTVPEATEEVAILVPVLRRKNGSAFLDSLRRSLTLGQRERVKVYVLADNEDVETIGDWDDARRAYANVVILSAPYPNGAGTFAQKVNFGYRASVEPWMFVVGDDVKFHAGWLDHAMNVARLTSAAVVGTNDLGNSAVLAGQHATHFFVSRSYVKFTGASWDGPGVLCHEGYRHWYVDNEIVEAAKRRGTWEPCLDSVVEHMHPLFGKSEPDLVYDLGRLHEKEDRELYLNRHIAADAQQVMKKVVDDA